MSNFWTDPFGIGLINRNPSGSEEEDPSPPAQEANNNMYYYYYTTPNYYIPQPQAQFFFYQQSNMNLAMNHYQPFIQYTQEVPAPAVSSIETQPSPHVCAYCTDKNKCKKCIKEEEKNKNYVTSPSFWNPRSKYNKSIFSNKKINPS